MRTVNLQYWRSLEHLERWTRKAKSHSSARSKYHKVMEGQGLFGVWCVHVQRFCRRRRRLLYHDTHRCLRRQVAGGPAAFAHTPRHETYVISPGTYENVYDDMPPFVRPAITGSPPSAACAD